MKTKGFFTELVVIALLCIILTITPILAITSDTAVIQSTGTISTISNGVEVTAESGYWQDIQTAINQVVAQGGIGNVHIPVGTFNFVNVGEQWTGARVIVPAGVNIIGANTEKDTNGQVVGWKTVLRLPWDVPGSWEGGTGNLPRNGAPMGIFWFKIQGNNNMNKPSRFSDIKMEGYRVIDPTSKMIVKGISISGVVNFRVDHVYLEGVAGGGIMTYNSNGVIDHSKFINHEGYVVGDFSLCTVGYGVQMDRLSGDVWDDDVANVLGHYTSYSVYIENCYFEKWRHVTSGARGIHYVLRHNIIEYDFGYGSIDAHGRTAHSGSTVTQVGTRAVEIYDNVIKDSVPSQSGVGSNWVTFIRGGAGVAFNNTVGGGGYTSFIYLTNEAETEVNKCWINDWYIWDNTMLSGCNQLAIVDPLGNINEGENYFLHAPTTFTYNPYPYPHPLTLDN